MHVVIFEAFIQFFQLFIALFHTERLNDKEKPKNPQHNSKEDNEEHCLPDRVNKCKNTKNDQKHAEHNFYNPAHAQRTAAHDQQHNAGDDGPDAHKHDKEGYDGGGPEQKGRPH